MLYNYILIPYSLKTVWRSVTKRLPYVVATLCLRHFPQGLHEA